MNNISENEKKEQNTLVDDTNDHKYFTIIPNIVFELGLSAQEIAVYCFIKKVAGERGACFMGMRRICETLKLNNNTLKKIKERLIEKKLISVEVEKKKVGGRHITRILDVWYENTNYFKQKKGCSLNTTGGVATKLQGCSHLATGGCSYLATKEELSIKEELIEEEHKESRPLISAFKNYLLDLNPKFKLPASDREWLLELDRMVRLDKRTIKEISAVIAWLRTSQFWSRNILSIPKLRKQFDRLILEVNNSGPQAKEEKIQSKEDNRALLNRFANVLCSNTNDPLVANNIKIEEHFFADRSKALYIKYSLSKDEIIELIKQNYDVRRPYIAEFLNNS